MLLLAPVLASAPKTCSSLIMWRLTINTDVECDVFACFLDFIQLRLENNGK